MRKVAIGIIGLGTVGEATLRVICRNRKLIERRSGVRIEIKKICDLKKEKRKVGEHFSISFTTDPSSIISDPSIDTIVELIGGIHPAKEYIEKALKCKKNVVTANKALLAEYGTEIFHLAEEVGKMVGFEAAVCGAIPIIKSISEGLVASQIRKLYGILNGTTNYILDMMLKEKINFPSALKEAKLKGFAERNTRLDVEGIDALHKLCILSYLCFGVWPPFRELNVEGISKITLLDIIYAEELSYRIKLLAIAKIEEGLLDIRVHPTLIPQHHPLAQVVSSFNAVWLDTHPAGELLFYGRGAGGLPTSSSVISDIVKVSMGAVKKTQLLHRFKIKKISDLRTKYYIRFTALDKPGVLAAISHILASYNISIASVTQKERRKGSFVPIVMITHEAKEENIRKALVRIDSLEIIRSPSQLIRIEDV